MLRTPPLRRKNRGAFSVRRDALRILWSEIVRTRDGYRCRRCGRMKAEGQIDAAHILGVGSYPNLKHVVENGITLCTIPCHRWYDQHKGRDHAGEADEWVKRTIGIERYTRLLVLAKTLRRSSKTTIRMELNEELRRVKEAQK